jgi:hypothetical protein
MSASPSPRLSLVLRLTEWGWRLLPYAVRGDKPLLGDWPQRALSVGEVISFRQVFTTVASVRPVDC